ncbi:MAG: alpha/beta fold hydrolase [Firmicutes bacterium]|nr:alpha/beta fold hydrolase [Bacillota bacterium]
MENYSFKSSDKTSTIQYYIWRPTDEAHREKPVAILHIIHGMSEYVGRYGAFASWLAEQGILVVGDDHIGHGTSADPADYGYFGHTDGWKHLVDDEEKLRNIMRRDYPNTPYVILGHSMGSFILRAWLAMYAKAADVDGVIIMGTCGSNKALGAGAALTTLLMGIKGEKKTSNLITGLAMGPYAKPFAAEKSAVAWLSRDKDLVHAYEKDPMCGFPFKLGGYMDLFALIRYITADSWYEKVPKNLTMLITSGSNDPVGDMGKGPAETYDKLQAAGCKDVNLLLYEDMRHEILNEIGKEKVWEDMRDFVLDMAEEHGLPQDKRGVPDAPETVTSFTEGGAW